MSARVLPASDVRAATPGEFLVLDHGAKSSPRYEPGYWSGRAFAPKGQRSDDCGAAMATAERARDARPVVRLSRRQRSVW